MQQEIMTFCIKYSIQKYALYLYAPLIAALDYQSSLHYEIKLKTALGTFYTIISYVAQNVNFEF